MDPTDAVMGVPVQQKRGSAAQGGRGKKARKNAALVPDMESDGELSDASVDTATVDPAGHTAGVLAAAPAHDMMGVPLEIQRYQKAHAAMLGYVSNPGLDTDVLPQAFQVACYGLTGRQQLALFSAFCTNLKTSRRLTDEYLYSTTAMMASCGLVVAIQGELRQNVPVNVILDVLGVPPRYRGAVWNDMMAACMAGAGVRGGDGHALLPPLPALHPKPLHVEHTEDVLRYVVCRAGTMLDLYYSWCMMVEVVNNVLVAKHKTAYPIHVIPGAPGTGKTMMLDFLNFLSDDTQEGAREHLLKLCKLRLDCEQNPGPHENLHLLKPEAVQYSILSGNFTGTKDLVIPPQWAFLLKPITVGIAFSGRMAGSDAERRLSMEQRLALRVLFAVYGGEDDFERFSDSVLPFPSGMSLEHAIKLVATSSSLNVSPAPPEVSPNTCRAVFLLIDELLQAVYDDSDVTKPGILQPDWKRHMDVIMTSLSRAMEALPFLRIVITTLDATPLAFTQMTTGRAMEYLQMPPLPFEWALRLLWYRHNRRCYDDPEIRPWLLDSPSVEPADTDKLHQFKRLTGWGGGHPRTIVAFAEACEHHTGIDYVHILNSMAQAERVKQSYQGRSLSLCPELIIDALLGMSVNKAKTYSVDSLPADLLRLVYYGWIDVRPSDKHSNVSVVLMPLLLQAVKEDLHSAGPGVAWIQALLELLHLEHLDIKPSLEYQSFFAKWFRLRLLLFRASGRQQVSIGELFAGAKICNELDGVIVDLRPEIPMVEEFKSHLEANAPFIGRPMIVQCHPTQKSLGVLVGLPLTTGQLLMLGIDCKHSSPRTSSAARIKIGAKFRHWEKIIVPHLQSFLPNGCLFHHVVAIYTNIDVPSKSSIVMRKGVLQSLHTRSLVDICGMLAPERIPEPPVRKTVASQLDMTTVDPATLRPMPLDPSDSAWRARWPSVPRIRALLNVAHSSGWIKARPVCRVSKEELIELLINVCKEQGKQLFADETGSLTFVP